MCRPLARSRTLSSRRDRDPIIVDGGLGEIHVRPSSGIEQAYAEKVRFYAPAPGEISPSCVHLPAVTLDGSSSTLGINAGLIVDLPHLLDSGADGIGLFRTELQFMLSKTFHGSRSRRGSMLRSSLPPATGRSSSAPSILARTRRCPICKCRARTTRLWAGVPSASPWSGRRCYGLQARALLKAGAGRDLRIMFPMVAEVAEYLAARHTVLAESCSPRRTGHMPPQRLSLGAMIEVPSLLFQLDPFSAEVDFVSVGSNDLMQFLFAADRGHSRLAGRYDPLSPANLNALRFVAERARTSGVPLNLCGEMAGRPLEAMTLIGLGFRSISMPPAAIGPVKSMVLALDAAKLKEFVSPASDSGATTVSGQI